MLICVRFFFKFAPFFFFFVVVLSEENSDLAGHMSFQKIKLFRSPVSSLVDQWKGTFFNPSIIMHVFDGLWSTRLVNS